MILRPVRPQSPLGPPISKAPVGLTRYLIAPFDQMLGQDRLDDLLDHGLFDLLVGHSRRMLGGQHHGVDHVRLAVDVAHGDLRLGVGTQPRQAPVAAQFGLALDQAVREMDRQRHQLRGFVAGVAEHQALVARALVQVQSLAFIHALGDVLGLLAIGDDHGAGVRVETDSRIVVADALDGLARDFAVVDPRAGGDFAGEHHQIVLDQSLGRDSGGFVLR